MKTERHVELETRMKQQGLTRSEMTEYSSLVQQRNKIKRNQPMVSQILRNVSTEKEDKLKNELAARDLSKEEIDRFINSLYSRAPHILEE